MEGRGRTLKLDEHLRAIPGLTLRGRVLLAQYTRFGIGGEALLLADAGDEAALTAAMDAIRLSGVPFAVIGAGSNLVASDEGFPGVVLRYTRSAIEIDGNVVRVAAGAVLQELTDRSIAAGLRGLETMTGIPGWVGGAVYGNAGAYGHSLHERVESVRYFDGSDMNDLGGELGLELGRELGKAGCEFRYRESIFKRRKDWIITSATLRLEPGDPAELSATAEGILKIRNQKYPPAMRCAGSIFKNLLVEELPATVLDGIPAGVIREGKLPSAYLLEQVGAKGMIQGGVRVADYHANLIYNEGNGTAADVRALIGELKHRVIDRFGVELEEEVQFL